MENFFLTLPVQLVKTVLTELKSIKLAIFMCLVPVDCGSSQRRENISGPSLRHFTCTTWRGVMLMARRCTFVLAPAYLVCRLLLDKKGLHVFWCMLLVRP